MVQFLAAGVALILLAEYVVKPLAPCVRQAFFNWTLKARIRRMMRK